MKTKIQIKSVLREILFEYEKENNTIKDTLLKAISESADLSNANLSDANLWNADLRNANLWNADLRNADLRNADLWNADLRNANLRNADLRNADLSNANLSNADLWNADLRNANLRNANLSDAKNIKNALLSMYSKWRFAIIGDYLKIGCKKKTFEEWDNWFTGEEEFETKRDTDDFKRIEAMYRAYKTYYEFLKK